MHAETLEDYERADAQRREIAARERNDREDARGLLRSAGLRDHEPWPREVKMSAAAVRSGVERGDPFAYVSGRAMLSQVGASPAERAAHLAALAARADHPVADDPLYAATHIGVVVADADGQDADTMEHLPTVYPHLIDGQGLVMLDEAEHERRMRLSRWQRLPE
jgi:hypothetical protein